MTKKLSVLGICVFGLGFIVFIASGSPGLHSQADISCTGVASGKTVNDPAACWGSDLETSPIHEHVITEDVPSVRQFVMDCHADDQLTDGDMDVMGNTVVTGNPSTGEVTTTQGDDTVSVSNLDCV